MRTLLLTLLFCCLCCSTVFGQANHYIIRAELRSKVRLEGNPPKEVERSTTPMVVVAEGKTATISISPKSGGQYEAYSSFTPTAKGENRIGLEFELRSRLQAGDWQSSKVKSTLLDGDCWESTIEDSQHRCTFEYKVTIWRVPPGQKFRSYDANAAKPIFEKI